MVNYQKGRLSKYNKVHQKSTNLSISKNQMSFLANYTPITIMNNYV